MAKSRGEKRIASKGGKRNALGDDKGKATDDRPQGGEREATRQQPQGRSAQRKG